MTESGLKKIVIIGAGDFGREILSTINDCNNISKQFEIVGFVDDNKNLENTHVKNIPVLGNIDWFFSSSITSDCIVAIGSERKKKEDLIKKLQKFGFNFPNVISPSAKLNDDVKLGNGVIIQHGTIISTDTKIEDHVYINYNCTVGHDCILKNFVTLAPGTQINGGCIIEERVYVGSGVITNNDITIGKDSVIGAGSIISKNIPEKSMYFASSGVLKTFNS